MPTSRRCAPPPAARAPSAAATAPGWTDGTTTSLSASAGSSSNGTFSWSSNTAAPCTQALPLYCFGVDRSATVSVPVQTVATVRRLFLSAPWSPSGGLAGADAVCQAEAGDHGLAGTYRALLASYTASAGITAASRFNTTGLPWARVDNVIVDSTAAAFFNASTTTWDAAINVTGGGSYDTYNTWAGAATLNTGGSATTTCANWTTSVPPRSAGSATRGRRSRPRRSPTTPPRAAAPSATPCSASSACSSELQRPSRLRAITTRWICEVPS